MANNYFKGEDLRSYFHSFGRSFTAAGQNYLDQAPLKSGHTVSTSDVRAEAVPYIDAEFKLEQAFNGIAAGTCILTGEEGSRTIIPELSGILKFYDGVALTEMAATNGETFQLIDGVVIKGFMDPTDQFDSTGKKTADGYTIKVLQGDGTPIPMAKGWVVDPVNGAVTFEKGKTPANQSFGAIKIVAFAYVGKYAAAELQELWNAVGLPDSGSDENTDETLLGRIATLEGAETTVGNGLTITSSSAKEDKTIGLKLTTDTNGLALTADGIKSVVTLVKDTSTANLTKFQLQINGVNVGEPIEIDKERFITSGSYDPIAEELVLAISGQETPVKIPVASLITEHVAGNGISITDITIDGDTKRQVSIKVDTTNSEDFLYVDTNGIGLSGVQAAIDAAKKSITDVYATVSYVDNQDTATLTAAKGYTDTEIETLTTTITNNYLTKTDAAGLYLKSISGSGIISVSEKADGTQTVSLNLKDSTANALVNSDGGLFVPKFVADSATISLTEQTDGSILIKGTKEYELPVANTDRLGGIKAGDDISIDESGLVTVNEAGKVKSALTIGSKTFDGSSAVTIVAADLGAITSISAGNGGISVNGAAISAVVKSDDKYIEITDNGIASKGIDTAISAAVKVVSDKIGTISEGTIGENISAINSTITQIQTDLDAAEVSISENATAIASEITEREKEITRVEGLITAEKTARETAIEGVQTSITSEITEREKEITRVEGLITAEKTARENGDTFISGTLLSGFTAENPVSQVIAGIQSNIDQLETDALGIEAGNGISLSEGATDSNKIISVKIDANEKVLAATDGGLKTNIELVKLSSADDGYAATYQLQGYNGTVLGSKINIPKDQFLKDAEFIAAATADDVTASGDEVELNKPCIKFTFSIKSESTEATDKVVYINVNSLVDIYTAGNGIETIGSDNKINVKIASGSEFITVDADGIKVTGITTAIESAIDELSGKIGGNYTSESTVANAIAAETEARTQTDAGLDTRIKALETEVGESTEGSTLGSRVAEIEGTLSGYTSTSTVKNAIDSVTAVAEGKLAKFSQSQTVDQVVTTAENGEVKSSGVTIGGSTMNASPAATTLATEAAVKAAIDAAIEAATLKWVELT